MTAQPTTLFFDLDTIVNQLEDLVKLSLECEKATEVQPFSFSQIQQELIDLRQLVDIFHTAYVKALADLNISEADVKKMVQNPENLPQNQKKIFLRLENLTKECEEAKSRIYESLQENRGALSQFDKTLKQEKAGKGRKKKKGSQKSKWVRT